MKTKNNYSKKFFLKYSQKSIHPLIAIIKMKPLRIGLTLIVTMLLLITALEFLIPHDHNHHNTRIVETKLSDSMETTVKSIASKFICNCGRCNKENLTKCKCKQAILERNTIRKLLSQKILASDIINVINDKYGGLVEIQKQR